jgi:hypothetical protein
MKDVSNGDCLRRFVPREIYSSSPFWNHLLPPVHIPLVPAGSQRPSSGYISTWRHIVTRIQSPPLDEPTIVAFRADVGRVLDVVERKLSKHSTSDGRSSCNTFSLS